MSETTIKSNITKKATTTEMLIMVDENDIFQGIEEKIKVHLEGTKHRAFSVFIYNKYNQLLLQKRSNTKYHSAGLWSNSCCGHPINGESISKAAKRRLYEELGFTCNLIKIAEISYNLSLGEGMFENEYTHIFVGTYHGDVLPNPSEISEIEWIDLKTLRKEIDTNPQNYSKWFRLYAETCWTENSRQFFDNSDSHDDSQMYCHVN